MSTRRAFFPWVPEEIQFLGMHTEGWLRPRLTAAKRKNDHYLMLIFEVRIILKKPIMLSLSTYFTLVDFPLHYFRNLEFMSLKSKKKWF